VYGDMNQSAVAAGQAKASVNVVKVENKGVDAMSNERNEHLMGLLDYYARHQENGAPGTTTWGDFAKQTGLDREYVEGLHRELRDQGLIDANGLWAGKISQRGMKVVRANSPIYGSGNRPGQVNQTFHINDMGGGPVIGNQSGGQVTGAIHAQSAAVGDGAAINLSIDQRTFITEFERQVRARNDIGDKEKESLISKAWGLLNSPVVWDCLKGTLAVLFAS